MGGQAGESAFALNVIEQRSANYRKTLGPCNGATLYLNGQLRQPQFLRNAIREMTPHPFSTSTVQYVKRSELGEAFTRKEALSLATRGVVGAPHAVSLVVVDEHEWEGQPIELATMSFSPTAGGGWRLSYVSHPDQSRGITAGVKPLNQDFVAFIEACKAEGSLGRLSLHCTATMHAEKMGPLALLDLRVRSGVGQVPEQADVRSLKALASQMGAS